MFVAPSGNQFGAAYYGAAAISEALGGGNWMSSGCGKCWKVTGYSPITALSTTLVLKGTNFCPPVNAPCSNGKAHFDIAAPGFDVTEFSIKTHFAILSALKIFCSPEVRTSASLTQFIVIQRIHTSKQTLHTL